MRQKPGIIDKTFIIRSFSGAIYPRSTKPSALSATANSRQKPEGEGDRVERVWQDPDETFLLSPYCSRCARQHVITWLRADEFSLLLMALERELHRNPVQPPLTSQRT
ncbi:unnamed protein product [Ixodes pacificus]